MRASRWITVVLLMVLVSNVIAPKPASANPLVGAAVKKVGEVIVGVVGGLIANCLWDTSACKQKLSTAKQKAQEAAATVVKSVIDNLKAQNYSSGEQFIKENEATGMNCTNYGWIQNCHRWSGVNP